MKGRGRAGKRVVHRRGQREAGAVRGRIELIPPEPEAEGIGGGDSDRTIQLLFDVCDEGGTGHFQTTYSGLLPECPEKVVMSSGAHVIEVERVERIVGAGDVGIGPVGGLP